MRRSFFVAFALFVAGLLFLAQEPHAQRMLPLGAGGAFVSSGPPPFSGLLDIAACGSNCVYWGTRAASVADKGNRLMNVCNVADVVCADLSSDATTGALVIGTIGGSSCSVVACTVKTIYDRGSGTFCNTFSTPCDLTQSTIANRPTLVVNCGGTGLPCLACSGTQTLVNSTVTNFTQPNSVSSVAERTGGTSAYSDVLGSFGGSFQFLFDTNPNQFILYAGSLSSAVAANDNTVHAIQGLYNGASSVLRVDGTSSSVSPGLSVVQTDFTLCAANSSVANPLTGNFFELAMWGGLDVSSNFAAFYANQKVYWSGIP